MHRESAAVPGLVLVTLPDEIDAFNVGLAGQELILAAGQGGVVIADMSATTFCDCAGVRAVVRASRRAAASGGELRLAVTAAQVLRLFTLLGLDDVLAIYSSVHAAKAGGAMKTGHFLAAFGGERSGGCKGGVR